jgi:hypothetical protein
MSTTVRAWRRRVVAVTTVAALGALPGLAPASAGPTQAPTWTGASVVAAQSPTASATGRGNPRAFRFSARVDGTPVHWNKCDRIGYRVYTRGAPKRAVKQAKEAVRRLNKASGLRFVYRGRSRTQASNFGRYASDTRLVIGWSTPRRSPKPLQGAGLGGMSYTSTGEITYGFVLLNSRTKLAPGFGRGPKYGTQGTIGQVLMHELGHAVGLTHVGARSQIMYGVATRKKATWGAGDRNGLVRVGKRRGCF